MLNVRRVLGHKQHDFTKMTAEEGFELGPPHSSDELILLDEPGWRAQRASSSISA